VTTRLSSCARLRIAHVVSTFVVCGVAALILPAPCEAVDAFEAVASASPDKTPAPGEWTGGASLSDPDPSDDDEDDDDDAAPDGPAATTVSRATMASSGESAVIREDVGHTPMQPLDGQNLRGPPSGDEDDSAIDDDDDDDRSDPPNRLLSALHSRALDQFRLQSAPTCRRSPDGPSLRAP
jgi:hypothetical protein